MANGFKTGGRTSGTPNKITRLIVDKLEALGCDPIEDMAHIAMEAKPKAPTIAYFGPVICFFSRV